MDRTKGTDQDERMLFMDAILGTPPRPDDSRCKAITRLELAIQLKLDLFNECLCPDTPCSGGRTVCGK